MTQLSVDTLLCTSAATVRDVRCDGACRHLSAEECASVTHLVFPYRGVYVRHVRGIESIVEANQVVFFNAAESYRISHPLRGGDACLSVSIGEEWLRELTPREHVTANGKLSFHRQRRLDARAQALAATLRHTLRRHAEPLEAEALTFTLVRRAIGAGAGDHARASAGRRKLVDRAKLVLASDPTRRWTLASVAAAVGVSPVYLTQLFQQVEGMPLYRYQMHLRLARALDLLADCGDLARLSADLGFSSHSHFSAAFRRTYGCAPAQFQRELRRRRPQPSVARSDR